jgi:hypothetical protein
MAEKKRELWISAERIQRNTTGCWGFLVVVSRLQVQKLVGSIERISKEGDFLALSGTASKKKMHVKHGKK